MVEVTRPGKANLRASPQAAPSHSPSASRPCPRCTTIAAEDHLFCAQCGYPLTQLPHDLSPRDPLIGLLIADRYRLVSKLGSGGMGTVYKVEHIRMGKHLALKLLHGDLSRDQTMIRRFSREARAISRLTSPHCVQCFDFGHDSGLFFIVMELLHGRDLGALLFDLGSLSPRRTSTILSQTSSALKEAHAKHIVHRDLKPENLFVCAAAEGHDEIIKVLDFGLAKLREHSQINTQQGSLMGTPHFMSPEQIEGRDVDHLADVYSLAAVTFKLLTGQPPYPCPNPLIALYKHLHDPIPLISSYRPDLSILQPFFDCALAKRPDERFQSVEALSSAFSHAISELPTTTAASLPPSPTPSASSVWLSPDALSQSTPSTDSIPDLSLPDLPSVPSSPSLPPAPQPEQRHLLPTLRSVDVFDLPTRKEFDRFERKLKFRQLYRIALSIILLLGTAATLYWGIALDGFFNFDREKEPNDNLKTATRLRSNHAISGALGEPSSLSASQDQDVFRIDDVAPGKVLTISATGLEGINILLEVVTMQGERLIQQDALGPGEGEIIPNIPMGNEPLFVAIREQLAPGQSPQFRPTLHYSLRVDPRDPLPNEEREPNNHLPSANPLDPLQIASGIVAHEADADFFILQKIPTDTTKITLRLSGVPRIDNALFLLDGNGDPVASSDWGTLSEGETLHAFLSNRHIIFPLYVKILPRRGFSSSQHYQLSFEISNELPPPPPSPDPPPTPELPPEPPPTDPKKIKPPTKEPRTPKPKTP